MVPEIVESDLKLAYSGLRPKLVPPGAHGIADFVIEPDGEFPRVLQLLGIESPGLTAATAIAQDISQLVSAILD